MHPPEGVPANDHIANNLSTVLTFRPSRDAKGQSWCALVLLLALALMLLSSCSIFLSSPGLSAGHERDSRGHRATHMRDPAALTTRSRQRIAEHDCSHRPRTPAPARAHNTIVDARVRVHSCELDTQQRAARSHRTARTSKRRADAWRSGRTIPRGRVAIVHRPRAPTVPAELHQRAPLQQLSIPRRQSIGSDSRDPRHLRRLRRSDGTSCTTGRMVGGIIRASRDVNVGRVRYTPPYERSDARRATLTSSARSTTKQTHIPMWPVPWGFRHAI